MSEAFGRLQDPHGCRAKVWIDKRHVANPEWLNVLRQCGRSCVPGSELCAQHTKKPPPHTKIGDIMSAELYSKCVKEQAKRAEMPKVEKWSDAGSIGTRDISCGRTQLPCVARRRVKMEFWNI